LNILPKAKSISTKILKGLGILVLVIFVIYCALGLYISSHHKVIVADINKVTKEKFSGDIKIGDVEILFFKHFPNITIKVKDVVVKDSLWNQHKKTFIDAKSMYVKILPWSIILTDIEINTIILENAKLDIFVDKNGYSNASALSPKKSSKNRTKSKSMLSVAIDEVKLKNVSIISENIIKHKRFAFETENLNIKIKTNDMGWNAKVSIKTMVKSLAFNTQRGSFAKDKLIEGEINADYSKEKQEVIVHSDKLAIGKTNFQVDAALGVSSINSKFDIHLFSKSIYWSDAAALVSNNISDKLYKFDFKDAFDVKCDIIGDFKVQGDPYIHVVTHMKNNTLTAVDYEITNCSMTGEFTNDYAKNGIFGDPNSAILLNDYKGKYKEIPFVTKNLRILDLTKPIASGSVESDFDIVKLNALATNNKLVFKKGKAKVNVKFKADVVALNVTKPFILGTVDVINSDFSYVPGKVNFTNNSIQFEFNTDRLTVKNITVNTERSSFKMSGYSENFMNLFYDSPEKIVLNWNIVGEKIDLGNFLYLMNSQKKKTGKKQKNESSDELVNKVFQNSSIITNVKVNQIVYKNFIGKDVLAKISLLNSKISLREISIKNENANYFITGSITDYGHKKGFNIHAMAKNTDIQKLLNSFENFGSTTVTSKTVKGTINLDANINGFIVKDFGLDKKSLSGNLKFTLSNAALINFEPIQKVGKIVFPNRDFKNVTIDKMNCDGYMKNGIVTIKPMEIKTSVMQVDLAGDYGFAGGTNMQVDVHLRNPKKDELAKNNGAHITKKNKGIIIHLKAHDDKNGKTKISIGSKKEKQNESDILKKKNNFY
jgi:hypothetical protein